MNVSTCSCKPLISGTIILWLSALNEAYHADMGRSLFKLHSAGGRVAATFDMFPHRTMPTWYAANCDEINADL